MDWALKRELREQLAAEEGYYIYPAGMRTRFALAYPNSYFVGMSNLGLHIIYKLLNERGDTACERVFLPDREKIIRYENTRTPLMSVETQTPLCEFDLLGFAVSYEMDYFHILKMLSLGKIKLRSSEREESSPLIIAGGPCATFNPEPLSLVIDAFIIGEGEVIMPSFMEAYHAGRREGEDRRTLLERLARVPGVYVPALYEHRYSEKGALESIVPARGAPFQIERQWVRDLDAYPAHTVVRTDRTEFNFYLIETARGCGRHCRFCMAGYCFRRPRNRSLEVVKEEVMEALPYGKRLGLMGAAISDYPEINELCREIRNVGLSMSVASFRADSVTDELVSALAGSGLKTLTIAPEAGSPRMRAVINKGIEEEHVFKTVALGMAAGVQHFKLYLMLGLPFEEQADIEAIVDLANRLKNFMEEKGSKGTLTLSVNPFIPKPFTPFQWLPMAEKKYIESGFRFLRQSLKKRKHIIINVESPKEACIQGVLARGDRRVAEALLRAASLGGSRAFRRAMQEEGLSMEDYLYRERQEKEIFPWDILAMGVTKAYLREELKKAEALKPTAPCFAGCHRCGVC